MLIGMALVALVLAASGAAGTGPKQFVLPGPPGSADGDDGPPAAALSDTIAYVRTTAQGHDQIRLIRPDGSGDRALWPPDGAAVPGLQAITSLAWRPDARVIAFTSDHEAACSWFHADLYTIGSDGAGLRRVTNAPSCAGLEELAHGAVTVDVQNYTFSSELFLVYVQGALGLQQIALGPGAGGTVTFPRVADLGRGVQPAVVILGGLRWIGAAAVDVQPGASRPCRASSRCRARARGSWAPAASPGTRTGTGSATSSTGAPPPTRCPRRLPSGTSAPTSLGVNAGEVQPCRLAWGPTEATAHRLLYTTLGVYDGGGVWLTSEGGGQGERVVALMEGGYGEYVRDVAWLSDGSGFVFSGFLFPEDDPLDYVYGGHAVPLRPRDGPAHADRVVRGRLRGRAGRRARRRPCRVRARGGVGERGAARAVDRAARRHRPAAGWSGRGAAPSWSR
jgi:hypothetical protein